MSQLEAANPIIRAREGGGGKDADLSPEASRSRPWAPSLLASSHFPRGASRQTHFTGCPSARSPFSPAVPSGEEK